MEADDETKTSVKSPMMGEYKFPRRRNSTAKKLPRDKTKSKSEIILGYSEIQMKREKALKKMGLTEADLVEAKVCKCFMFSLDTHI